jgi:uncharacterized protein YgiM (DUF1202 family)
MKTPHLTSALALGAAVLALSVGGAFAAVTVDSNANLMAGPGQNFKTVARLQADTNVVVTATNKDWCKIDAAGTKGWIACANLNGLPAPRVNSGAKAKTSYDYENDPYLGPTVPGGLHTLYNGSFF